MSVTFHKGRGALSNPPGRFEKRISESIDDGWGEVSEAPAVTVSLQVDQAKSVLTYNDSPDMPFDRSINPYRGCEHGCIYCFARPSHAYLGLSPGLEFETQLFYKPNAVEVLRAELAAKNYRCNTVVLGPNTDAYQPVERHQRLTRDILQLLHDCRHPVSIITKSALIERDLDLLVPMAQQRLVSVAVSVCTLQKELARQLEPRAASPRRRLQTIERLSDAGIPVMLLLAPVIPAVNDHEMEDILQAAAEAGAKQAAYVLLRLPHEVKDLFSEWLQHWMPNRTEHVMSLLRQMHRGKEYDSRFGRRLSGEGQFAELLAKRFRLASRRFGYGEHHLELDSRRFRAPQLPGSQGDLFAGW